MKTEKNASCEPKERMEIDTDRTEAIRGRSRKKPGSSGNHDGLKRAAVIGGILLLCVGAGVGGWYVYQAQQYREVFLPNTMINSMDASGKTIDQIKEDIESGMKGYVLTLKTREGTKEQISGDQIGLHAEYDGTLETILSGQNPYRWGFHQREDGSYSISTMMAYDENLLEEQLNSMDCLDPEKTAAPEDAFLSDYIAGTGYEIIPEEQGNRLIYEIVVKHASEAILNLQPELSLEELGAYEKPQVYSDNPELTEKAEAWNRYVNVTITHQFGDKKEVLDGSTIHTWLSAGTGGAPVLDEEKVAAYVKSLANTYNTAYKSKTLKTSYGPTVTISQGNYGWRINQGAETAALVEIIRSGEGQTREPVYSQKAASHGARDYGDTYVEINLTAQHLYYYKDGKLLVEADFVSGNEAKGWSTPAGAYPLTYKQRDATLKGEGYATPVSYWMPFNGGIGLHDAGWRSSFGGTIYKNGGSHGCINLPPSAAKTIYENISAGMPVLCYHLPGTEKGSSTNAPAETTAAAPQETTAATPQETTAAKPQESTTAASPETPISPLEPSAQPSKAPDGPGETGGEKKNGAVAGPGM